MPKTEGVNHLPLRQYAPMTRNRFILSLRVAFTVACLTTNVTPAAAQTRLTSVRAADSAWARSYATNDTALALALFDKDLFVTATNGSTKDRAGEIADVRPYPGTTVQYFRTRDVMMREYSGTAVVTGLAEWQTTTDGQASVTRRRYTSVFVQGGPLGWKMVALHIGRAPGA